MSVRNKLTLFCVTSAAVFAFIFGNEADGINIPDLAILLGTVLGILTFINFDAAHSVQPLFSAGVGVLFLLVLFSLH